MSHLKGINNGTTAQLVIGVIFAVALFGGILAFLIYSYPK
jgi:hypothetical protein